METQERILVNEDRQWINEFKSRVSNLANTLNTINKAYPIKTANEIPGNPDQFIFQEILKEDKTLSDLNEKMPLTLDKLKIPPHLAHLRELISAWKKVDRSGIEFIERNESGFYVNAERLEKHIDSFRNYAVTPEQLGRLQMAINYERAIESLGLDPTTKIRRFQIPMVVWNRPPNATSVYPGINLHWVMTGELGL